MISTTGTREYSIWYRVNGILVETQTFKHIFNDSISNLSIRESGGNIIISGNINFTGVTLGQLYLNVSIEPTDGVSRIVKVRPTYDGANYAFSCVLPVSSLPDGLCYFIVDLYNANSTNKPIERRYLEFGVNNGIRATGITPTKISTEEINPITLLGTNLRGVKL